MISPDVVIAFIILLGNWTGKKRGFSTNLLITDKPIRDHLNPLVF